MAIEPLLPTQTRPLTQTQTEVFSVPSMIDRIKQRVSDTREHRPLLDQVVRTVEHYGNVKGNIQAGAITYFGFISFFPILALIEEGDEVIYPNPGFPIYESQIVANGAKPVPIHLHEGRGFSFDPQELERLITPKTRLLILNYPHNPTGGCLSRKELETIAAVLKKHPQVWVYADEIYSRLLYEGEHKSIAAMPGMEPLAIVLDGFSKTFAMTGWRLGYGVMPAPMAQVVAKLQTNATSCTAVDPASRM